MIVCGRNCEVRRGSGGYYLFDIDSWESFIHPTLNLEEIAKANGWKGEEGGIFPWIKDEESILKFIDFLNNTPDVITYWNNYFEENFGKEIWDKVKENAATRKGMWNSKRN